MAVEATWTPPKDWQTGAVVTAAEMNTYISNNLLALKNRVSAQYRLAEATDYSTTSTSFVDVDATRLALTLETTGGHLLVGFHGVVRTFNGMGVYFDVDIDGTRVGGDDGITMTEANETYSAQNLSFVRLVTGIEAGSHTVKLQWKKATSTANAVVLYAGGSSHISTVGQTVEGMMHPQFWVLEV